MGWLWTISLNGAVGLAGYWGARYGFRQPAGVVRVVAAATLAWAWVTLGVLVLGLEGWLSRGPLCLWAAAGLALAAIVRARGSREIEQPVAATASERWEWSAVLALGLVVWAACLLGVTALLLPPKIVSDGPIYHLYFAARWWKAARLFLIAAPFGETAATYFPAGGDLWFTWLLTGLGNDHLARIGQAPFLLLAALAVYATTRLLAARASAAMIATAWFTSSHLMLAYSFEANVDTIFIAGYLAAVFFGLRHALGERGSGTLALAALAAGLAWGTKPTATVFIVPLLLLGALHVVNRRAALSDRLAQLAMLLVLPLLVAGYWFGRNAWLTDNPLYPLQVEAFGRVWLPGCYNALAMRQSQFYVPASEWRGLVQTLCLLLDPRLIPFWLAAAAGVWAIGHPDRRPPLDRWVWACSGLAVLNVVLCWFLIPYRTQQRFMLQMVGLAAVPLARLFDRSPWIRRAGALLLFVHLTTPQTWPIGQTTSPIFWNGLRILSPRFPIILPTTLPLFRSLFFSPDGRTLLVFQLVLGVGCCLAACAWLRGFVWWTGPRWALAVAMTGAMVVGTAVVIREGVEKDEWTFPRYPGYERGWRELDARCGPSGARIAYAGTNLPYYLMGARLRNDVRYINVDEHPGWLLHDYHRAARERGEPAWDTPRPGWHRLHADYEAWLANLRAAQIQLLVVTRANPADGWFNIHDQEGFPIERTWAEAHPEVFQPLYGVAEKDPQFRIYRLKGKTGVRERQQVRNRR